MFPWLKDLQSQKNYLVEESIDKRLSEIKGIYKFLKSDNGQNLLKSIYDEMISFGFPEYSSKIELNLLCEIFLPKTLDEIFYNPSNGLKKSFDNGSFNQNVVINNTYGYLIAPKGLVFIIGSANTILPVITSTILSYISGNVTVCQLSKSNSKIISKFINCRKFSSLMSKRKNFVKQKFINPSREVNDEYWMMRETTSVKSPVLRFFAEAPPTLSE